jgi:hypothetical protein
MALDVDIILIEGHLCFSRYIMCILDKSFLYFAVGFRRIPRLCLR